MTIQLVSSARIPTTEAQFELRVYKTDRDDKEHLVLKLGDLGRDDVLIRIHSECFTGDVLASVRCDCGQQLQESMRRIANHGHGAVIYLRQEGRGIGLAEKLKAYNLQDAGYDTVEANLLLGHEADARDYSAAARLLLDLGVSKLRLLTNNPAKVEGLSADGLEVTERIPIEVEAHHESQVYLATKARRMRHLLDVGRSDVAPLFGTSGPEKHRALCPARIGRPRWIEPGADPCQMDSQGSWGMRGRPSNASPSRWSAGCIVATRDAPSKRTSGSP